MPKELSLKSLLENFPSASRTEWIKVASSETGHHDVIDKLTWKGTNDLSFPPYFDQQDRAVHRVPDDFKLPPSNEVFSGPRSWHNLPLTRVNDETTSNREALLHLQQGADGILFECYRKTNFRILLNSIQPDFCRITFQLENDIPITDFAEYVKHIDSFQGNLFWKKNPQHPERILSILGTVKKFSALGIIVTTDPDPVQEIIQALWKGAQLLDRLTDHYKAEDVIPHISFLLEAGHDFFFTYGKIKALRMLWYHVARAFGISSYHPGDTYIHMRSEPWVDESNPHSNMLKGTTASIAAVCGGCNGLTVDPEDTTNEMMVRVARNVSNLLREEAHLNAVADPMAGSYFAETLVYRLASLAWEKFQSEMKSA